jgi:hypothetical protein
MAFLNIYLFATFPGFTQNNLEYYLPWVATATSIVGATFVIWLILNLASTVVTLFSIIILVRVILELGRTNPFLKLNYITMILHAILLSLQSVIVAIRLITWFLHLSV